MNDNTAATPTRTVTEAEQVDAEIMALAEETEEWFNGPIDWEDFIDRMDGTELADGAVLDMGPRCPPSQQTCR